MRGKNKRQQMAFHNKMTCRILLNACNFMLISITITILFNFDKTSHVFLFLKKNFKISCTSVFTVYFVEIKKKNVVKTFHLTFNKFVYMRLPDLRRIARITMALCTQ